MLDTISKSFIPAFLPVSCGFRLLAQHHGRAMGEKMHGRESHKYSPELINDSENGRLSKVTCALKGQSHYITIRLYFLIRD